MPQSQAPTDAGRLAERREFVRRSVLRANRAIGVILALVLLLGVVLVFMILEARGNQRRAEAAEAAGTDKVWKASLAQARAENLSTQMGHREAALEAVHTAAKIRPSPELRNEAISALTRRDLVPLHTWDLRPDARGFHFDPDLKYYLVRYSVTDVSMFRMADNSHVRDFPMPVALQLQRKLTRAAIEAAEFQFSATGKYTVIRYSSGVMALYETETGRLARVLGLDPATLRTSWPPGFTADDKVMGLPIHGSEGTHLLYDIEAGKVKKMQKLPEGFDYTGGFTNFTRLSPRGDVLAWFGGKRVSLFDSRTGDIIFSVETAAMVQYATWDTVGGRLLFTCDNFAIYVLERSNGRVIQLGDIAVETLAQSFSPDGRLLVTSGNDGITRLWDVAAARLLCRTTDGRGLVFARSGDRIGWGIPGRKVGAWGLTRTPGLRDYRGTLRDRSTVWQADMTADGRYAVWAAPGWVPRQGGDLMDLETGSSVFLPMPYKNTMGFHPATGQLFLCGPEGLRLYDMPLSGLPYSAAFLTHPQVIPLPEGFVPNGATFSAGGRYAALPGPRREVIICDTSSPGKFVRLEEGYDSHINMPGPASPSGSGSLALSPDGRWAVCGRYTAGGSTMVWDAGTGRIAARLDVANSHTVFSRDGRMLFTAGFSQGALWETGTWRCLWRRDRPPLLHGGASAAFGGGDSGGDPFIAWNRGMAVVELLTISGEPLATLDLSDLGITSSIRCSSSGHRLFAGGMEGRMISLDLGELRRELAAMHLDWPLSPDAPAGSAAAPPGSALMPALLGLIPVAIAAVLGGLVLRRQGRLTREFVEATEVASLRERELAAEREVSELKSRFVSTVSHEFRTPLGITMSAVELLRHYEARLPPDEKTQLFDDIHTATRNMAGLMEQVLVLGRVDAGKLACKREPLSLELLATRLVDEVLSATNRRCPIEWTAENDLSGAHADEALLRHIFTNLLSNGVKYSPAGTAVHFSARREGLVAVFTVRDRGIGIPAEDLPALFEAFNRASNVGDTPGTGLGLVICKRCAELHGGSIQVKSAPGEGTAFTVRIPAWA